MMEQALVVQTKGSRWIPYAFIAFFGVVLLANGAMIWLAFATWTGLETERAYQKGLAYNRVLDQAEAQASLGWHVDLEFVQADQRALAVKLALADRRGDLIEDARVSTTFYRPTHEGHDRVAAIPHRYGGEYEAQVELPLAGQWDVHLSIERAGEIWREARRVYLRP
jgi:nitrogen fixation protein FixH